MPGLALLSVSDKSGLVELAVGLVGHIAEEMRNPIAYEIYERAEKEVAENGLAKG